MREKNFLNTCSDVFFDFLKKQGIKKGSGSYKDYEKAKKLILPPGEPSRYTRFIKWISKYLKV